MQRPRDDFQTDALRPAALPSASLKTRTAEEHTIEQTSDAYLDSIYEDWNKKVDIEVETLVEGMVELVNIASIGNKDKYKVAQEAFEAQCRTESMVRSRVDERTYTNYFPPGQSSHQFIIHYTFPQTITPSKWWRADCE